MNKRILIAWAALGFVSCPQAQRCAVCDLAITTDFYRIQDQVTEEQKPICQECASLARRCYLCGLPVKNNITQLQDGRVLCARDAKGVILSPDEARQICDETRNELGRMLSRFLTFPATNVSISMVDKVHMEQLFQTPGFDRQCPSIFGYIRSRPNQAGGARHAISLLSGLPRARLMATCAHEMAHSWLNENLAQERQINRDSVEGFCELIAFKLMSELGQEQEQKVIQSNRYTRGQFGLFLDAETRYGFYTIMQWMKSGLDSRLTETDLDRVRQTRFQPPAATPNTIVPLPQPAVTPVPDTLTLIGISGVGNRGLALIDNRAFSAGESGRVRVGQTNVVLRCLEIRSNSVVIEVAGSAEKQELFLKSIRWQPVEKAAR